jgi:hypothetical protein
MAKFRFLIEASADPFSPFHLGSVDPDGETNGRFGDYQTLDAAKAAAEEMAQSGDGEQVALQWKPPPVAWQPDAIVVSQYLDEMYETNPP